MVKAVLNETPFPGPFGPLHSCDNLSWGGDLNVHWGASTSVTATDCPNNHYKIKSSWPRVVPPGERIDLLRGYDSDANFTAYKAAVEGEEIGDPWFRYLSGGPIADAPNGNPDPWAFAWDGVSALTDGQWPNHDNGGDDVVDKQLHSELPDPGDGSEGAGSISTMWFRRIPRTVAAGYSSSR